MAKKTEQTASTDAGSRKEKKMTTAVEIYTKLRTKHEAKLNDGKMTKREFRAEVVEALKKALGIDNNGTVGMYYSIADKRVTGRSFKSYNRVAERKPNLTPDERAARKTENERLKAERKAQREAIRAAAKAVKEGKNIPKNVAEATVEAAKAYDQITNLVHAAEVARHSGTVAPTKAKAARKAPTKKTTTAKKATASKKPAAKKATARKTPAKKSTAKKSA
jgi:hypothetical protein